MSPLSNEYQVVCLCGANISVSAFDAGTSIQCKCGRSISVPMLSELRLRAGREAYETNSIDVIRRMMRDGELPQGSLCAVSGVVTNDTLDFIVLCESPYVVKDRSGWLWSMALALFSFHLWIRDSYGHEPQVHGREVSIRVPLRVDCREHARLRKASQRVMRRLLMEIPAYAELLREYPAARIEVASE